MSLALFDFDGTVTMIDTTLPLGASVIGEHSARHRLPLLVSALVPGRRDCHPGGALAGIYTGRVVGTACHGHEKLKRAVAHFGATALQQAIAYGNVDDSPLLHAVRTGYVVRRGTPARLLGRLRQCSRVLSGQLNRDDLTAASSIELFPTSHSPWA